jgi:hypothetical protein
MKIVECTVDSYLKDFIPNPLQTDKSVVLLKEKVVLDLVRDFKEFGVLREWESSHPIQYARVNDKNVIVGGHHRYAAFSKIAENDPEFFMDFKKSKMKLVDVTDMWLGMTRSEQIDYLLKLNGGTGAKQNWRVVFLKNDALAKKLNSTLNSKIKEFGIKIPSAFVQSLISGIVFQARQGDTSTDLGFWKVYCNNKLMRNESVVGQYSRQVVDETSENFKTTASNLCQLIKLMGDCLTVSTEYTTKNKVFYTLYELSGNSWFMDQLTKPTLYKRFTKNVEKLFTTSVEGNKTRFDLYSAVMYNNSIEVDKFVSILLKLLD